VKILKPGLQTICQSWAYKQFVKAGLINNLLKPGL
jgi:hypothetical protein